jgi:hypothetical protein
VDIVLGVSMTPTTVRMVLVEGEKADGVTVDHDVFDIPADDPAATAPDQVVAAILGTRESATEGGHRLVGTGVTWRDHAEAAALRDALAARKIDDVMLVSELHAAGALAQAVGRAVGYERTALMFLERNTATLSVVDTADGSIVKVQSHDLHTPDAVAELAGMVAGLETLPSPPQGVFVVGSGVAIGAIKLQLESATSLPVSAPDEPEVALARGAALASAHAPLFEASTVGLSSAREGVDGTTAGAALAGYAAADVTQAAGIDYTGAPAALAYSEADPESQAFPVYVPSEKPMAPPARPRPQERERERKPFLLVGSALTSIFVLGVTALVISLAVSIRPTVDQRPSPAESVIVPTQVPEALVPTPAPAPAPETIKAPVPVVQEAPQPQAPPRTVFVERPAPAPAAPAPAPAAPAPAPAPAAPVPAPVAPPVVAPVIPAPQIVLPPPVIQLPQFPIFRPPWDQSQNNNDDDDWTPPWRPTQTQTPKPTKTPQPTKTQQPEPTQTFEPEAPVVTVKPTAPSVPQVPTMPIVPTVPQVPQQQQAAPEVPQVPQIQLPQLPQWPGSGSGSSGGSGGSGSSGRGGDSGSSGRGGDSGGSRGGSGGGPGSGGDVTPLWPFD